MAARTSAASEIRGGSRRVEACRTAWSPVARQGAEPRALPLTLRKPLYYDQGSPCSSRRRRRRAVSPTPVSLPNLFVAPANEKRRTANYSTPDRPAAAGRNHAPAANYPSPAPARDGTRSRKARNIPATHLFCRSVHSSRATSAAPLPRATVPLGPRSIRAPQPTRHPRPVSLARIRAASSNAEASPLKTNPIRRKDPDAPRRSSRDRQICFSSRGGIRDIFRCGESRRAYRAFRVPPISHAATSASCVTPASPTPARGNSRRRRLPKSQTHARADPAMDSAHDTPDISALPLPLRRVSKSAPFFRPRLPP